MSQVRSGIALLAAVAVLAVATDAHAQKKVTNVKGKLHTITGNMVLVVNDAGAPVAAIQMAPQGAIALKGTATPDFLTQKGIFVQLNCMMNRAKEVQSPVKEMNIVDANSGLTPGFGPEGGPDAAAALKADPNAFVNCLVRGTVTKFENGELQVATPQLLKIPVADDAKINVNISDYTLAKPGDEVVVIDGDDLGKNGNVQGVKGNRVEIKAVAPIEPKKKTLPGKKR